MSIEEFRGEHEFLSNFYPIPDGITWNGESYPTVEHAYQAAKTTIAEERRQIQQATTPGRARALGQKVTLRTGWVEVKIRVMRLLLEKKFAKDSLRSMLLATGEEELVEGNKWGDRYWGKVGGVGENYLGRLLMEIRGRIRERDQRAN